RQDVQGRLVGTQSSPYCVSFSLTEPNWFVMKTVRWLKGRVSFFVWKHMSPVGSLGAVGSSPFLSTGTQRRSGPRESTARVMPPNGAVNWSSTWMPAGAGPLTLFNLQHCRCRWPTAPSGGGAGAARLFEVGVSSTTGAPTSTV